MRLALPLLASTKNTIFPIFQILLEIYFIEEIPLIRETSIYLIGLTPYHAFRNFVTL